jgi:hypothetical protein
LRFELFMDAIEKKCLENDKEPGDWEKICRLQDFSAPRFEGLQCQLLYYRVSQILWGYNMEARPKTKELFVCLRASHKQFASYALINFILRTFSLSSWFLSMFTAWLRQCSHESDLGFLLCSLILLHLLFSIHQNEAFAPQ